MPKRAICKFRCTAIQPAIGSAQRVHLHTQYDETLDEDRRFCKATPSGDMSFLLENPSLDGFFEEGKNYYVEVYPAD